MINTEIRLIIFFAAKDGDALWSWSAKPRPGAYRISDHELLTAKFRLKLNKVEKTIKPFGSVQLLSCIRLSATPWTAVRQASLPITSSWSLSNSCPLSRWGHPTISSSVVHFSSCLQSFPFCCFPLFLCIDHWGRLSYLSLLFFGTLHSNGYMFPFLLCL